MSLTAMAAVVPSWNTGCFLERCIASLTSQDGVSIEMIVIDNGSEDNSLALIEQLGVRHVALPQNIGFASAVNLGAEETRAPFVLVLNADCFLAPGCARLLAAELDADRSLGGVQPLILQGAPPDECAAAAGGGAPRTIFSAGQSLTRNGSAFERGWGEADAAAYVDRVEVFGVSGAACVLRRELFAHLGGYNASYFAFYEDVD